MFPKITLTLILALVLGYVLARFFPQPARMIGLP